METSTAASESTPTLEEVIKQRDEYETRFKGAMAANTPVQQENARLKAQLEVLQSQPTIPSEVEQKLEELKFSDPDAWYQEKVRIQKQQEETVNQKVKEVEAGYLQETKQQEEKRYFDAFFQQNPTITAETLDKGITVAMNKKYEAGEITLPELLQQGMKNLQSAPVAKTSFGYSPNIGGVAGSSEFSEQANNDQSQQDWTKQVI